MTTFRASARSFMHRLAPLLSAVLLAVLFLGGIHHHADGTHDACVVCAASHSPAVTTALRPPTVAPTDHFVAVSQAVERAPSAGPPEAAPQSAPPLAPGPGPGRAAPPHHS